MANAFIYISWPGYKEKGQLNLKKIIFVMDNNSSCPKDNWWSKSPEDENKELNMVIVVQENTKHLIKKI